MKKTALLLGAHCHQPVDNFREVVDEAIERAYKPFFREVVKYKDFKFSIHYSGWLLEYIKDNDKELFSLMKESCENDQVEFLGGGYYEPILASIPSKDRIGQIKKLNKFIKKHFKQEVKGLWLTERVWDNSIISDIKKCGIEYVVVDDYHFISAGFDKGALNGYFVTEEGGEEMKIFPINKTLRYILPFKPSGEVIGYLEGLCDERVSAGVIFDDGEKFGIWPKTYEWVYEKGWLEEFLKGVLESEIIEPMKYKEYIDRFEPLGIAYLPTTSYFEMGEWSLRADDAYNLERIKRELLLKGESEDNIDKFLKGSIWKNFLVKYNESNRIHKRVLELSKNRKKSKKYKENLYKAQTNDVLWHGVFGGIYLPNLRDNAYRFIIECDNIRDKKRNYLKIEDNNFDGFREAKLSSSSLIAIFDSKLGAQMTELSLRDKAFNLQNTLTRYKEAYHEKLIRGDFANTLEKSDQEEGIDTIHSMKVEDLDRYKEHLKFDWYIKNSFIDHITDFSFSLDSFDSCSFNEYGDFANQPFLIADSKKRALFKREGGIYKGGVKFPTTVLKSYKLEDNILKFYLFLESESEDEFLYFNEFNFHFASLDNIRINGERFQKQKSQNLTELWIEDLYTDKRIVIRSDREFDLYQTSLDSLSQSESGFDIINQGISFALAYKFKGGLEIEGQIEISPLIGE